MEQLFALWGPTSALFWVRAIWALVTLAVLAPVAQGARRGTRRALLRVRARPNAILFLERVAHLGILALGAVLALAVLGVDLAALTALVGLATIALSLSLQDIARSLIAGLYLLIEQPFQVGDTVEVGGQTGVIEDVGLRTTILRNTAGDRVVIPNLVVFTGVIIQKKATPPAAPGAQAKDQP